MIMESIDVKKFRNRIGRSVRQLRREEGISAQFLAKVLGVTQATISRIENGITSITADKLCFLASTYNKPLSYFIGEQSPIFYDEEDILRAGAVFYGATHLKSKRTINIQNYYRTYSEFLNAALKEVTDTRFTAALATTLYQQSLHSKLNFARLLSTIQNERLIANLFVLIDLISNGQSDINRPKKEKETTIERITKLKEEFAKDHTIDISKSTVSKINPNYVADFINESF
jgi:transcriptional regulator with XRE-family HTH domain